MKSGILKVYQEILPDFWKTKENSDSEEQIEEQIVWIQSKRRNICNRATLRILAKMSDYQIESS